MKKAILSAALLSAAAAVFVSELYRYTFCRESSRLLALFLDKQGHAPDYYAARDAAAERLRHTPSEPMEIRSERGERLRGWYYPLGGEGRRVAFLIHGYRSEHAETAGMYLHYYASRGFDLFCCDHTAHGESGGRFIGFDVFESADCLRWIEALRRRCGEDVQILLHGFSMGAATVLRMSSRCPEQVRLLAADCGFADGETQLRASLGVLYPLMRALHRAVAGCDLRQSDVLPSLRESDQPVLIVHGEADATVPFENAKLLFDACPGQKDCLFVPGARHVESMYRAPKRYAQALDRMIEGAFCCDRKEEHE